MPLPIRPIMVSLLVTASLIAPCAGMAQNENLSASETSQWIAAHLPSYYAWRPLDSSWKGTPRTYQSVTTSATYWAEGCSIRMKSTDKLVSYFSDTDLAATFLLEGSAYPGKTFPGKWLNMGEDKGSEYINDVIMSTLNFRDIDVASLRIVTASELSPKETETIFFLGDDKFAFPFDAQADAHRMLRAFRYLAGKCGAKTSPF